jgi:hypothetical protein
MSTAHEKEVRIPPTTTTPPHAHFANGNGLDSKEDNRESRASMASNIDPLESESVADSKPGLPEAGEKPTPQTELEKSKAKTAVLMFALCMCVFLAALDTTIITTALPTIAEYFKSSSGYTWIGSAYLLGSAASVPIYAKFSDIFASS